MISKNKQISKNDNKKPNIENSGLKYLTDNFVIKITVKHGIRN